MTGRACRDHDWCAGRSRACCCAVAGSAVQGRFALDSTAANVVPWVLFDGAVIETTASDDAMTPGVEGSVLFVRMVHDGGTTVLDRPFDWPADEQRISPGRYDLTAYWRTCVGNCSNLDGEDRFCEHDVTVAAGGRIRVGISTSQFAPGSRCTVVAD